MMDLELEHLILLSISALSSAVAAITLDDLPSGKLIVELTVDEHPTLELTVD